MVEVEGECQLEVRGELSISELTKKLKKIDASVEINKIVPDGVTEPEIKIRKQDEGKRPIKIQKASKPLNDGASSSNRTASQNYGLMWEQAKGVGAGAAEQAKAIGAGAAKKAKAIGAEAFNLLPNNIKWHYEKKNHRKEHMAVVLRGEEEEMKEKKIRQEKEKEKKRIALAEEEMKQNKIRQEKEEERKRKQALADEMKRQQKMKEEEKRRKQALAEEEEKQKKIKQEREDEKRRKQALENNSGACII